MHEMRKIQLGEEPDVVKKLLSHALQHMYPPQHKLGLIGPVSHTPREKFLLNSLALPVLRCLCTDQRLACFERAT